MTPTRKHGSAEHLGPAVNDTSIGHRDLSVGQMIQQAMAESNTPSGQESAAEAHLPPISIPHGIGDALLARIMPSFAQRSPDDSGKGDGADISVDPKGTSPDPLNTGAAREDLLSSLHPDPVARRDEVNDWIPGGRPSSADLRADVGITYGSSDAGAQKQAAVIGLVEQAQASREKAEGMLGKYLGNDGFTGPDELRSDGKWHNTAMDASDQGITITRDYIKTDDGGWKLASKTVIDSNNHTVTTVRDDGSTVTSKDGKVIDSSPPLELPSSTPDNDRPSTLPPLSELFKDVLAARHPDDTITNSAGDEIPGTVSSNVAGPIVDHPVHDSPADPGNPNAGPGEEGIPNGTPGTPSPSPSGNLINTTEAGTDRTGPEEPSHHQVNPPPPAPANADAAQGSGTEQSGIRLAETPAQQAAQQLRDAPLPGPGGGQEAHQHDGTGFADLIRAAHNPQQSGLGTTHQSPPPDALPHLGLGVDIANHGSGPHAGDDGHAVSLNIGQLAALHDTHLDHHAAPLLDVTHTAHH